jgi:hypothetical protein
MKHIIFVLLFIIFVFSPICSLAQTNTPTPTSSPNMANCDSCGYCQDTKASLEERWEEEGKDKAVEWQRWVANWRKCQKCLYSGVRDDPESNDTLINLPTPDPESHYTMIGCISTNPGKFTKQVTEFFFRMVGGIAFLFLLYGAGIMATSQADPERLNQGKRIIYGAIIGLLFVLFSTFIFNFIAVNVLKIPGFGG